MRRLTFEATVVRLAGLAVAQGGTVALTDVEEDGPLMENRGATSAAARMLASGSDVVAEPATDSTHWFPYSRLTFTRMSDDGPGSE